MSPSGGIAAIVLAAGESSRMGASKPLLPLGHTTVIERVVDSLFRAAVNDLVVVTGHGAEKIVPVLDRLGVRRAHNALYRSGMFSSVQVGAEALPPHVEAFFVLPADYPLVRPEVLGRLIDRFGEGGAWVLHPTCAGMRGHPPLLSGRSREALLQADSGDDLRSFLARLHQSEAEVEVEDLTILMDMDTAEDHERLARFAATLGGASGGTPTPADALYLLALLGAADNIVRHCETVALVGAAMAEALKPRVPRLDVELVRVAGLLHDMVRTKPSHAVAGQRLLANLGLRRLGEIVGAHMVLPAEHLDNPRITEEQVVYLADKMVVDDTVAGIEARARRALSAGNQEPAVAQGIQARVQAARAIAARIETILGRSLDEVI